VWFALGLALSAKTVLMVLAAPEYAGAVVIMPIVILAMVMHGAYLVPVGLLFQAKRTWPISFATLTAGGLNVAANLVLVPYLGIRGAAIATLISYVLMLFLVWRAARTAFPVPYQYRRLAKLGGIAIALYLVGQHLPEYSLPVDLLLKVMLWGTMPVAVWFGGLLSDRERSALRDLVRDGRGARRAGTAE
jgi:O-antigen/teichoic acid export membrane protein